MSQLRLPALPGVLLFTATFFLSACSPSETPVVASPAPLQKPSDGKLYIWLTDADEQTGNFLAVVNGDPASPDYGQIETTVLTEGVRGFAHHTSLILPSSGFLFANDYNGNYTWVFDTNAEPAPKVIAGFGNVGEYSFAHSFDVLPNGNMIASFQTKGEPNEIPGGILELTPQGEFVRAGDADIGDPNIFVRPYGLTVLPKIDRIVSTNFDMKGKENSYSVQVWRLSDLALLHTVMLPGDEEMKPRANPFEARALPDGESLMIETMSCGLYYMSEIASESPRIEHVHTLEDGMACFLPVQSGDYWIQTVGGREVGRPSGPDSEVDKDHFGGAVRVFDISNPQSPQVVQELSVGRAMPHWTSANSDRTRILVGGFGGLLSRMLMLKFDPDTGAISIDENFGEGDEAGPGLILTRDTWPHGDTGPAIAHGSVFGS